MKLKKKFILSSLALALFSGTAVMAASEDPLDKLKDIGKNNNPSQQPILNSNSTGADNIAPTYETLKELYQGITKADIDLLSTEANRGFNPIGMYKLGVANEVRGNTDLALSNYSSAITMMPKSIEFYKGLLSTYDVKSDFKSKIHVFVNGRIVSFDSAPKITNGNTLVPIRAVSESLGALVEWDEKTDTATINLWANTVVLKKNNAIASLNGQEKKLAVPAQSINGRIYVPLRFINESFGMEVKYLNTKSNTVIIPIYNKN